MEIFGTDARIVAGVTVAVAIAALYAAHKADKAGHALAQAIDPTSANNVFYKGVNGAGAAVTGNKDFSLGVWAWELLNPNQNARDNGINAPVNINPQAAGAQDYSYFGSVGA